MRIPSGPKGPIVPNVTPQDAGASQKKGSPDGAGSTRGQDRFERATSGQGLPGQQQGKTLSDKKLASLRQQFGKATTQSSLPHQVLDLAGKLGVMLDADPARLAKLHQEVSKQPSYQEAREAVKGFLAEPTMVGRDEAAQRLEKVAGDAHSPPNMIEVLLMVMGEAVKQTNEDKKYFLEKLKGFNDMGEALGDYLAQLGQHSDSLGAKSESKGSVDLAPPSAKSFDLQTNQVSEGGQMPLDKAGLESEIKKVESMQEEVRNKRQMASSAFESANQKANQYVDLLSQVLKAMKDTQGSVVRNLL